MSVIVDVAEYLEDNNIGTVGTDIFESYLPDTGTQPCIGVFDTGGLQPDHYLPTKEPTFQIIIRSNSYAAGKTKLDQIRALLHQKAGTNLIPGSTFYYFIFEISEGGHIGRNEAGMDEFSVNFQARTR